METSAAPRVRRTARPPAGEAPFPRVAYDGPRDGAAAAPPVGPEPATAGPHTVETRPTQAATTVPPVGATPRRRAPFVLAAPLGAEAQGPRVHAAAPGPFTPLQGALDTRDPPVDAALATPMTPTGEPVGGGPAPAAATRPAVVAPTPRPHARGNAGGAHRPTRRLYGPMPVRAGPP